MDVDTSKFLEAMALAATQATVVTTSHNAQKLGVTVSAFASLCAEPPMVLVCINQSSPVVDLIAESGHFAVNLLGAQQIEVADCFAGRSNDYPDFDFSCAEWATAKTGSPILVGATASFDCKLEAHHDYGTHRIHIGRVLHVQSKPSPALAFSNRAYQTLSPVERINA